MSEQMKRVVLNFIGALDQGNATVAAQCLTEDAHAVTKGFSRFSGTRQHDAILGTIASLKMLMPGGMRPEIVSVTAEGDRVVVEFEGNATLANGKRYCNQYCWVFTLQDDRIRQINEYMCTILADEVVFPLVGEGGL